MMSRLLPTALAVSIVLLPLAALSSQPEVKVIDLAPQAEILTAQPGFDFFLDPDRDADLRIRLPRSINEFDIDRDPFETAKV
ncbi:MAG: hypothetical protein KKF33_09615 [Alphaproteobacteria bacterium]|nr:hypothetical protein [Alphaproteobacteria bacterium]